MSTPDLSPLWTRLAPVRIQADDNPASVRVRKYLTGTHLLLAAGPALVAPSPRELAWQRGPVRLWHYTGGRRTKRPPIVIVYAMILRPYILDLAPGRSLVAFLVEAGHDVWLVDWGSPHPTDSTTDLDTYIDDDLHAAVTTARDASGSPHVTLFGHCQGGTLSAIYAAMHADQVRNLVLLAAPIDFAPAVPHLVGAWSLWSRLRWYDPAALIDGVGNVPTHLAGRAVHASSAAVARSLPWLRSIRSHMAAHQDGRVWLGACQWVDDSPSLPGTAWVQWMTDCYQRNALIDGRLHIHGHQVRLETITAAVLRISGRRDVIAPPHQMARPEHLPGATDFATIDVPAGHVGMVVGPDARTAVYEPLARWLAPRSA